MSVAQEKRLRALIWCAVSSPEQAADEKESIPAQERDLRAIAESHNYEIVDVLIVPGFSRKYLDIYEFANDAAREGIDAGRKLLYYMDDPSYRKPKFDVFLVRDADRFGRTQALLARIAEAILVEMNLLIHSQYDGLIDGSKARMFISMAGYRAAGAIDDLKKKRVLGMPGRAKRGLHLARKKTHLYYAVFDRDGNEVGIEIDRSKQKLWDDLATLILEGVSWNAIEIELFRRFGHAAPGKTPKPYRNRTFYDLVHTPPFWGHMAWNYRPRNGANKTKTGFWVFDPSETPPDGVMMFYNKHAPVYSGDLAERVKAELRRRRTTVKGRVNPERTLKFSGLMICGDCLYRLAYHKSKSSGYEGYRCMSHFYKDHYPERATCGQRKSISVPHIREWFDQRLRQLIERDDWSWLFPEEKETTDTHQENVLVSEIADLERKARVLIRKQATAPDDLQSLYEQELSEIAERLNITRSQLAYIQQQKAQADEMSAAQSVVFHELKELTIDGLWIQEETRINRILHTLMGHRRLVIFEGRIIEIADDPRPNR